MGAAEVVAAGVAGEDLRQLPFPTQALAPGNRSWCFYKRFCIYSRLSQVAPHKMAHFASEGVFLPYKKCIWTHKEAFMHHEEALVSLSNKCCFFVNSINRLMLILVFLFLFLNIIAGFTKAGAGEDCWGGQGVQQTTSITAENGQTECFRFVWTELCQTL